MCVQCLCVCRAQGLCTGVAIYSRLARREHAEAYTDLFQAGLGCGGPWLALGFSVLAASASMLLLEGIVPLRIEALRRAWGSPGFHVDGLVMQAPKDQGTCTSRSHPRSAIRMHDSYFCWPALCKLKCVCSAELSSFMRSHILVAFRRAWGGNFGKANLDFAHCRANNSTLVYSIIRAG